MKWQTDWENLLMQRLNEIQINTEKTAFKISNDLKKYRDNDWNSTISSGQILDISLPSRKGGAIKLISTNTNGLPVEVGSIQIYSGNLDYKKAIVGQLIEKKLYYATRDTRYCLEFDQPVILVDANEIPSEILASKTFQIKQSPKGTKDFTSCSTAITITVVLIIAITILQFC